MQPVITIEAPEHVKGTLQARLDWATVTGKELMLKPAVFRHTETGEAYCNIVGGMAYPVSVQQTIKPGMVVVVGIQNEPKVLFRILDAYESQDVFDLITHAVQKRRKYGFGLDSRILPHFMGDQEKYLALITKASEAMERLHGPERGLYIKDLVDLREQYAFPLYVRQMLDALKSGRMERPSVSGQHAAAAHLQSFQPDDAEKGKVQDFPAIGLLGGMIHSLQIERPWLESTDGQDTAFNIDG